MTIDREARPLYRLPDLIAADPGKQVVVVEGEKCADAYAAAFPDAVVTTWVGSADWDELQADWSPVYGRRVALVADGNEQGRVIMLRISQHLQGYCPPIQVAYTPDLPEGERNVSDWIAVGGPAEATKRIAEYSKIAHRPTKQERASQEWNKGGGWAPPDDIGDNPHFEILGSSGSLVVAALANSQIEYLSRGSMTQPSTLISLADINFWLSLIPSDTLSPKYTQHLGSALLRAAERRGPIDMSKVVGRGAFWDHGKLYWNLGDKLLVDGAEKPLKDHKGTFRPLGGPPLRLDAQAATDAEKRALCEAALEYRWASPLDCKRFMGWLVTSLMGGALEWRPHVWLAAPAERGKSYLLKKIAPRILGPALVKMADPTEPGVARSVASDSLPIILEEAEPGKNWTEATMTLIRIAAGEDGSRVRAVGMSGVQIFNPRFSALLSSTTVLNMSDADDSRIAMIELSPRRVDDWEKVDAGIQKALAAADRFRTSIVLDTAMLASETRKLSSRLIADGMATRKALITAALSVAWQWWSGTSDVLLSESDTEEPRENDAVMLLRKILSLRLRTDAAGDRSMLMILSADPQSPLCADYGVRLKDADLLIAPKNPGLLAKLRPTHWRRVNIGKALCQIEGVEMMTHSPRFGGARMRALRIPRAVLDDLGFDLDGGDEEDPQQEVPF